MKKLLLLLSLFIFVYAKDVKIVALDPAVIEIIYMLDGEKSLKAIAHLKYSTIYPKEKTEKLPSVGTFSNPSIEKIMSFKPDVVILSTYSNNLRESLENLKVKTYLLESNSFKDIEKNVLTLGEILHKEAKAKEVVEKFRQDLDKLSQDPLNKSVTFLYSSQPLMAFSNVYITQDVLNILGLKNIAPTHIPRPILTQEYMIKANPDIVIYGMSVKNMDALLLNNAFLSNMDAFKNDLVFKYDDTYALLRGSPRIVLKIEELKNMLHSKIDKVK